MWNVDIENIAGIRSGTAHLNAGLNVVQASNFSGKSSFMAAMQTVMGTTNAFGEGHPLQDGSSEGSVTLETEDTTYKATLKREHSDRVSLSGDTIIPQDQVADRRAARLFAMLGEDNPLREAVRTYHEGDDDDVEAPNEGERITELLQDPIDIDEIEAEIAQKETQRQNLKQDKADAKRAADNLPAVEEKRQSLKSDIADLENKLEQVKQEVAEETTSDDSVSEELQEVKENREDVKTTISDLETKIEQAEQQIEQKKARLEEIEIPSVPEVNQDIESKQSQISDLESDINLLNDLIGVNKQVLDESAFDLISEVDHQLTGDEFQCWVCGEDTDEESVQERLDSMRELVDEKQEQKEALEDDLKELKEVNKKEQKRERLKDEKKDLEDDIADLRLSKKDDQADLEQAKKRKESYNEKIAELEEDLEKEEKEQTDKVSSIKSELGRKQRELESANSRIESLEEKAEKEDELEREITDLAEEIKDLRAEKSEKQRQLVDEFNDEMESVVKKFAPGFGRARLDVHTSENGDVERFKLNIARDGRSTEIDSLSEGEVELIGVVLAVAGYRTFDVDEIVPMILIDGISELAAEHLHNLTEYLEDTSEILLTTAYPEAGGFDGEILTPEDWDVVSDTETATA
jgi:DNA repair exonuclease SbcCD ATPase subunit